MPSTLTTTTQPTIDTRAQVEQFVDAVFEPNDWVEVRLIHREKGPAAPQPRSLWSPARALASMVASFVRDNRAGWNVHVGANPRRESGQKGDAAVPLARCLFVDFDDCPVVNAFARIADTGLPEPTLFINSGHGVHVYWRLAAPLTDMSEWVEAQKDLVALLGTDKAIVNPERLMRLPGFLNIKREPVPVHIVEGCHVQ